MRQENLRDVRYSTGASCFDSRKCSKDSRQPPDSPMEPASRSESSPAVGGPGVGLSALDARPILWDPCVRLAGGGGITSAGAGRGRSMVGGRDQ